MICDGRCENDHGIFGRIYILLHLSSHQVCCQLLLKVVSKLSFSDGFVTCSSQAWSQMQSLSHRLYVRSYISRLSADSDNKVTRTANWCHCRFQGERYLQTSFDGGKKKQLGLPKWTFVHPTIDTIGSSIM